MTTKDPLKSVAKTIQTIASGKTGIKSVDKQKKKDAILTKNLKVKLISTLQFSLLLKKMENGFTI